MGSSFCKPKKLIDRDLSRTQICGGRYSDNELKDHDFMRKNVKEGVEKDGFFAINYIGGEHTNRGYKVNQEDLISDLRKALKDEYEDGYQEHRSSCAWGDDDDIVYFYKEKKPNISSVYIKLS